MKNKKKMVIAGCTCLVAGLMACGIGAALGGSQVLRSPMLWIEIGPNSGMGFRVDDSQPDVVESEIAYTEQETIVNEGNLEHSMVFGQVEENAKEVRITAAIGNLNLKQGKTAEIQSNLPDLFDNEGVLQLHQNVTDGIWELELDQNGSRFNLPDPDLNIILPDSVKSVYIDCGVGDLTLVDLNLETLEINTSAADVQVQNCMLDSLNTNLSMGDLSLSGCSVNRMNTDLSAGGLNLETTKINQSLDADLSAGGAVLSLIGDPSNYNLDLNVSAGLITVGRNTSYDSYVKSYPNAKAKIRVDASMGEIQLDFASQQAELKQTDEIVQEETNTR